MALSARRGTVTAVTEALDELVRLEVDGAPCVAYPRLTGPVEVGDDVVVNVQAAQLGLGSGGFDVLLVNLTRGLGLHAEDGAHVMTLPYTPLQQAVRHVEEDGTLPDHLAAMPVVCCSLHSQVVPVAAALRGRRAAYVQVGGGALPVSLSDAVRALKGVGLLGVAVAAAPCVDGDVQAVNVASALAWCGANGYEVAICAVGPGIVGTGSRLGHGAASAASAIDTASALGATPILAARYSDADPRARHRGVSHHTEAVRDLCVSEPVVAWPADLSRPDGLDPLESVDVPDWRAACDGLPLSHMSRGPDEDPRFFAVAFAAGRLASGLAG